MEWKKEMIKIKPIIRGIAAATVAALFTGCVSYQPSGPGYSYSSGVLDGNVFFLEDPAYPSAKLTRACPHGAVKQPDKYVNKDGNWYVIQRYRCLGPESY